ncbi:hypothetical protein ACQ4PT_062818 [Festuca glaucescens]
MARSGAAGRVLEEYTVRDKTYFPLNIGNTHWMTVVMHMPKQEFQVLDSLYPLDFTLETVEALVMISLHRRQIGQDMQVANGTTGGNYPDVTKWPILEYDMPQQRDGNSCGLFVIECMEHWDGDRMSAEISQMAMGWHPQLSGQGLEEQIAAAQAMLDLKDEADPAWEMAAQGIADLEELMP